MEDNLAINAPVFCGSCNTQTNNADAFCDNCGYPLKGTQEEQNAFISDRTYKEIDLEDYNKKIRSAGVALYWIAGLCFVSGVIVYAIDKDESTRTGLLIINTILTMIFVFLGAWSKKKPLAAIISGATLYGILLILYAIDNPISIISGIWVKIIIIGALIKGIKSAIDAEKLKKELNL